MSHNRLLLSAAYLATVLFSTLLYWLVWQRSPDYFVVQQEVNLYPIASLNALLWEDHLSDLRDGGRGLADLAGEADRIIAEARTLREQQAQLRQDTARLEDELASISRVLEENRAKQIDEYRRNKLASLQAENVRLEDQIATLEKRISRDATAYDPLRIVVAEARVEFARQRLRLAEKRLEVADRIVKEYGQFAKAEDLERWKAVDTAIARARVEMNNTFLKYANLRSATFDLVEKWRRQRQPKLGLLDFLYFSLGISTTTTFGDIIPNHSLTRGIATCQLLVSVVIVGLFVNSLSADHRRGADVADAKPR